MLGSTVHSTPVLPPSSSKFLSLSPSLFFEVRLSSFLRSFLRPSLSLRFDGARPFTSTYLSILSGLRSFSQSSSRLRDLARLRHVRPLPLSPFRSPTSSSTSAANSSAERILPARLSRSRSSAIVFTCAMMFEIFGYLRVVFSIWSFQRERIQVAGLWRSFDLLKISFVGFLFSPKVGEGNGINYKFIYTILKL